MKILVIGGTLFVGRHVVTRALARGHEVVLFNRGVHGTDLFPGVERIRGDREVDLDRLAGRSFDAVVDTCGYVPRVVGASAQALKDATAHYTFISTISVYKGIARDPLDEASPLAVLDDPTTEVVDGETYGGLKALCEEAAQAALPGRTLVIRPGLIVGPWDPTDRFTWWPVRVARGGEVLAPGDPDAPVQFIDVRDLAELIVHLVEGQVTGVFNATGPRTLLTMGELLLACRDVARSDARLIWVSEEALLAEGVAPWSEMPLWVPMEMDGLSRVSSARAYAAGLSYRPLEDTIAATLSWANTRRGTRAWKAGLSEEKERAVLAKWADRGRAAAQEAEPLVPA